MRCSCVWINSGLTFQNINPKSLTRRRNQHILLLTVCNKLQWHYQKWRDIYTCKNNNGRLMLSNRWMCFHEIIHPQYVSFKQWTTWRMRNLVMSWIIDQHALEIHSSSDSVTTSAIGLADLLIHVSGKSPQHFLVSSLFFMADEVIRRTM